MEIFVHSLPPHSPLPPSGQRCTPHFTLPVRHMSLADHMTCRPVENNKKCGARKCLWLPGACHVMVMVVRILTWRHGGQWRTTVWLLSKRGRRLILWTSQVNPKICYKFCHAAGVEPSRWHCYDCHVKKTTCPNTGEQCGSVCTVKVKSSVCLPTE